MPCIIDAEKFKTKKAFKEAAAADPRSIWVVDPSIVHPREGWLTDLLYDGPITVTNHPKRSWFASVEVHDGRIKIK